MSCNTVTHATHLYLELCAHVQDCAGLGNGARALCVWHRSIATEAAKKEVQRTVLGVAQPGETLPIPYGWQRAGETASALLTSNIATGNT